MLADSKRGQRKQTPTTEILSAFCETHILGIIAHFSDIIEGPNTQRKDVPQTSFEGKRCIAAIGDLVNLAKASVSGAIPQVLLSVNRP